MSWTDYIEQHQDELVARLAEAVAIPSVSAEAARRPECVRMVDWLKSQLEALHVSVEKRDIGTQILDGKEVALPPVLLATYGSDPRKKTVLVYGHVDVQPADMSDGWNTEPFQLHHDKQTDRLYGRGSTDDKGPVLGWLNVIEAHQKTGTEFPVNLQMCFECMEESGSEGLDALIQQEAGRYFKNVDVCCISDNYWLGTDQPCVTYGLRGITYIFVTIEGPQADLHSGVFGGSVHEPMTELFALFSKLVTPDGKILIPGIDNLVAPLTPEERQRYADTKFSIADIENATGRKNTISDDKVATLMARMRYPSLSIHGIEGAFSGQGAKTVIPAKVTGKFSIRLVPDMLPEKVMQLVNAHLTSEFAKLGSKNKLSVKSGHDGKAWLADPNHYNYQAAIKATEIVYKKTPDLTREGGSIPVTLTIQDALKKSVCLLPMGRGNDMAHSMNEKLDLSNYIKGSQMLGHYLHEIAKAQA